MKDNHKPIHVTQPSLPPLDEFQHYLKQIWDSKWITNNGPFHQQLEKELAEYLGVKYISLFANGTLALITALQALKIKGEVITTPYSFVATSHSLWWNGIKPVFVDVDPVTLNLNPEKIETAITPNTTAIMPVHVYGTPCDTKRIDEIAKKYNLKVIYDAAHAFKVEENEKSILNFGDLSILSFHATKVFSTIEGGAIVSHSAEMKHHIDNLKNFGFRGETVVEEPGINAKMNEMQAAFGLLSLKYIDETIAKRKKISDLYDEKLKDVNGVSVLYRRADVTHNYSYYPIFIDKEEYGISRDELYEKLKAKNVFSRRYFYPLISEFKPYSELNSAKKVNLPIAFGASNTVLCLPIYADLLEHDCNNIVNLILK